MFLKRWYFQDNFYIIVETYHLPDRGDKANVHELEEKKLKKRAVVNIDIANDPVASADFKADQDPKTFKSEKTGRGPLTGNWKVSCERKIQDLRENKFIQLPFKLRCWFYGPLCSKCSIVSRIFKLKLKFIFQL